MGEAGLRERLASSRYREPVCRICSTTLGSTIAFFLLLFSKHARTRYDPFVLHGAKPRTQDFIPIPLLYFVVTRRFDEDARLILFCNHAVSRSASRSSFACACFLAFSPLHREINTIDVMLTRLLQRQEE